MADLVLARPVTAADRLGPVHPFGAGRVWDLYRLGRRVDPFIGGYRTLAPDMEDAARAFARAHLVEIERELSVLRASGVNALLEVDEASGWWRMFGAPSRAAAGIWLDVHVRGDLRAFRGLAPVLWEAIDPEWSDMPDVAGVA